MAKAEKNLRAKVRPIQLITWDYRPSPPAQIVPSVQVAVLGLMGTLLTIGPANGPDLILAWSPALPEMEHSAIVRQCQLIETRRQTVYRKWTIRRGPLGPPIVPRTMLLCSMQDQYGRKEP